MPASGSIAASGIVSFASIKNLEKGWMCFDMDVFVGENEDGSAILRRGFARYYNAMQWEFDSGVNDIGFGVFTVSGDIWFEVCF